MSDLVQWIIVGAAVAAAVAYLVRRLARPKRCCESCASCPLGEEYASRCEERRDS